MMRMSPRTSAGFSMLAASIAAPRAVPWPIRLCSSSTNRIRSESADSSRTSLRMRSSYWPRNVVPASSATWSSATRRASFRAGGPSPTAMHWASPSTIAVLPTPAFPISAGLFLFCRRRMSTTRAISASRQRTGSRSPRRAFAVRSTPTRSSTVPESSSPSNGSPIGSVAPQEVQVPDDDRVAEHERHPRPQSEEYPERDESLLAERQGNKDQAAEQRPEEHRQEHALPAEERPHHCHHLDVAAPHRFFFERPLAGPGVLVGDEVVPAVGDRDAEQQRREQRRRERVHRHSIEQQRRDPDHAYRRLDDRVLHGDGLPAVPAPPLEQQPRDHRDVVVPRDGILAARTGRGRPQERHVVREPYDADVEEAPDAEPEHGGAGEQDRFSDHASPRRAGCPPRPRR